MRGTQVKGINGRVARSRTSQRTFSERQTDRKPAAVEQNKGSARRLASLYIQYCVWRVALRALRCASIVYMDRESRWK